MKKRVHANLYPIALPIALAAVWCIWSESFHWTSWLQGAVLGGIALLITRSLFLNRPYLTHYRLPFGVLAHYVGAVFVEIFRSGFHAIRIMVTDRLNVGVVDIPTPIHNPLAGTLVATAITLTPGTVTIDYSPGRFKVIWIDCFTNDPTLAAQVIKGRYERVIRPLLEATEETSS